MNCSLRFTLAALTLAAVSPVVTLRAASQWALEGSTLTYHVSHPLHQIDGVSRAARGKGVCDAGVCDFLIAVPVKSFDSGDSNRDLHMLQATRGAQYPLVSVRTKIAESAIAPPGGSLQADLEIQFAGQTAQYKAVPFIVNLAGAKVSLVGVIPATLADFKIDPPSLLSIAIKNEIPVKVATTWHKE